MSLRVHDTTRCLLGEGALWHPERERLYWCDILSNRILCREGRALYDWTFDRHVSCAGWVDRDRILVATETDLCLLDLETGAMDSVCPLEADRSDTRSNDGRADPWGGFWVSTMGLAKAQGAGALYRFYQGEMRRLRAGMTIPNTTCFPPDAGHAYFSDTPTQQILRWRLDGQGWPVGEPEVFVDLRADDKNPDGAVCDAEGNVWNAQWGASRIAVYGPDGAERHVVEMPARQVTCPAFGGPDLTTLYCTSAAEEISEGELAVSEGHGRTFEIAGAGKGQAEHKVRL